MAAKGVAVVQHRCRCLGWNPLFTSGGPPWAKRLRAGKPVLVAWEKSGEGIVASGNESRKAGRDYSGEGLNGNQPNHLGAWSICRVVWGALQWRGFLSRLAVIFTFWCSKAWIDGWGSVLDGPYRPSFYVHCVLKTEPFWKNSFSGQLCNGFFISDSAECHLGLKRGAVLFSFFAHCRMLSSGGAQSLTYCPVFRIHRIPSSSICQSEYLLL